MPVEVVEAADLIGAVIGAITRTDAAVIGHIVEPLGRVRGRVDRADVLARGLFAVLASDGLKRDARLGIIIANEIAIDADPAHLAAHLDGALTDRGDVIFGLAGDRASVTSDAGAQIDDHTPAITNGGEILLLGVRALIAVVDLLPERRGVDEIDRAERGLLGALLIFVEREIDGDRAPLHPIVRLSLHRSEEHTSELQSRP